MTARRPHRRPAHPSLRSRHAELRRLNLTGLLLDANSLHLAEYLKGNILRFPDGIFWAPSGKKFEQDLAA